MTNIINYCNEIYEILCSIDKKANIVDSDSHIWNDRERYLEYSGMTLPNQSYIDSDQTDEELYAEDLRADELLNFLQEDYELGYIGRKCECIRKNCLDKVMDKFLSLNVNDRKVYVRDILNTMLYIRLNHPLAERTAFQNVVVPELFQKLIEKFQDYNIKLDKILSKLRPLEKDSLCSLLNIIDKEQPNGEIPNQLGYLDLKEFFIPQIKESDIIAFIEKLEENGIVTNRIYDHKNKNYLAKLICYMQGEKIIKKDCDYSSLARCFYGFFGKKVGEKAGENIVTISNVRKILRKGVEGLSVDEKSDFSLICSVFIPRRE